MDKKGIPWGPFTLRIPLIHTRFSWSEYIQGVTAGSAAALLFLPMLVNWFGLTEDEALAFLFLSTFLTASSPLIFGENLMVGLMTPVFPLVIAFFTPMGLGSTGDNLAMMIALSLDFALISFFLGISGFGPKIINSIPNALKAGIILGAAIAALKAVFIDRPELMNEQPIAIITALLLTLFLSSSTIFQFYAKDRSFLLRIASLGLIPGMVVAGFLGYVLGEIEFFPQWRWAEIDFISLFHKVSPISQGWPDLSFFLQAAPLALIAYIICFGDIITGNEITKEVMEKRPDDPQHFDINRTNLSMGIRNAISAIFAPFFSYQGILATGPHIIIVDRWKKGKKEMNSIFDGIGSYTSFGFPWFYFVVPLMTFLVSLQGIIFTQFMVLTAIGCCQVAMSLVKTSAERGSCLLMAVLLISFPLEPGKALIIGSLIVLVMVGWGGQSNKSFESDNV